MVRIEPLSRAVLDGVSEAKGEPSRADLGLLLVFEDERPLQGLSGFVDWRTSGSLTGLVRSGICTGRRGESVLFPGRSTLPVDRLVLFGLGLSSEFDAAGAADIGERVVAIARDLHAREVMLALPSGLAERDACEALLASVAASLEASPPPAAQPQAPPEVDAEPVPTRSDDPSDHTVAEPTELEPAVPAPLRERWWAVADGRVAQRLRSLLSGPPRAAGAG
jgi:hypothetical protein